MASSATVEPTSAAVSAVPPGLFDQARARYPNVWTASRNDLCFATTNRQTALQVIAQRADAVVVIGSANSSNTLALAKVAKVAKGFSGLSPARTTFASLATLA